MRFAEQSNIRTRLVGRVGWQNETLGGSSPCEIGSSALVEVFRKLERDYLERATNERGYCSPHVVKLIRSHGATLAFLKEGI